MAGKGSRLAPLPCSKEILPVGLRTTPNGARRPKALVHYLLECYAAAGIEDAVLVIGAGKWDIAQYLTLCGPLGVNLAYVGIEDSPGTPFSLDQAHHWVQESLCALGFPDILLPVRDPFGPLLRRQAISGADVVLGLFPTDEPRKVDTVEIDADGRVTSLVPKPEQPGSRCNTWSVAVWSPDFSRFMHDLLAPAANAPAALAALLEQSRHDELYVGDIFNRARGEGLTVDGVLLSDQPSRDIGTPESLADVSWK